MFFKEMIQKMIQVMKEVITWFIQQSVPKVATTSCKE